MSKQSQTDWKALETMTDEEIDYSDIPPLADMDHMMLVSSADWEGFDVGSSSDFAVEVKRTAQNKRLAQRMAERRKQDKGQPRVSLKQVRQELGLE